MSARHASAPTRRQLIRHHSPSAGTPMVLSDKMIGSIARTFQSSGPWLASGLYCPTGSSLTMAASESLRNFRRFICIHTADLPLSVLFRAVPERFPNLLCTSFPPCRLPYPVGPGRCLLPFLPFPRWPSPVWQCLGIQRFHAIRSHVGV